MDGVKKRLNVSIQRKLSFLLLLAIFGVAVLAGLFSFVSAFDEAHELQDDTLRQVASLVGRQAVPLASTANAPHTQNSDEESRVIVQQLTAGLGAAGQGDAAAALPLPLPPTLADGLHTLEVGGESFRVLVTTTAGSGRFAVAQRTTVRDEIARDGALRTVMPFLLLMPVLLLVVADLVRKMFLPMAALSAEIDQRAEQALHPIDTADLPAEVRPFAVAINRLLVRVGQSMQAQRRFVADAAHELRSPLTALSLQAERLAEADLSGPARERLAALQRGIGRGRLLLDQLLTLAKAQTAAQAPAQAVSVLATYRRVLEDLMPLAEAKRIDIGVEGAQDAAVMVGEPDLLAMVRNLVDNAIRYTPEGGRVDLSVRLEADSVVLQVTDSGPGIAADEQGRVFDPFYRTLGSDQVGSGLGLSIVKAVADRLGAEVRLDDAAQTLPPGLRVSVLIPKGQRGPAS